MVARGGVIVGAARDGGVGAVKMRDGVVVKLYSGGIIVGLSVVSGCRGGVE